MTAPERIVVNRQYVDPEGQSSVPFWHEDKGGKLDPPHKGYRVPPTRYVRADLYDAAVAERDAAVKLAEVRIAQFENERRAARLAEDALLKMVAERDEARRLHAEAVEARDEAMREAETLERQRDAARAEVERLRPVVEAAQVFDRFDIVDLEHGADLSDLYWPARRAYDALEKAVDAYRAAKEGNP